MLPDSSTGENWAYVYHPMPPSCTIKLMYLVLGASFTIMFARVLVPRLGSEFVISKPHQVVQAPFTTNASPRVVVDVLNATSMMARSPGYWRKRIGFPALPATVSTKAPR